MIAANVASCVGMDFGGFDLTPLGERRPKLPLQRKVKQLQRPWQSASTGARVVPNRFRWASSQQRSINESPAVARPRSGAPISRLRVGTGNNRTSSSLISRRRPSTGPPQAPSRHQGETQARPNDLPASSKGPQPVVRWDGTAAAWTPRGHAINNGAVRSSRYRPSSTGPGVKLAEKHPARRVSGEATSTALQHSPLSSPSFFASSIATETTATDDDDATTGGGPQQRKRNENAYEYWRQTTVESKTTIARQKNLVVTAANKPAVDGNNSLRAPSSNSNAPGSESTGSRPAAGRRRPYSASGSLIHGSSTHPSSSSGSTSTRPQTVGAHSSVSRAPFSPVSSEGFRDVTAGAGGDAPATEDQLLVLRGTESGGDFSTSFGEEGRGPGSSSVGGRVSVSVVLPVLEKENDATRDERCQPGSSVENPGGVEESSAGSGAVVGVAGEAHPASLPSRARDLAEIFEDQARTDVAVNAANFASTAGGGGGAGGDKDAVAATDIRCGSGGDNVGRSAAVLRMQSPHIGALGYYVGEDSGPSRLAAKSALHGKALVGSHHYYKAGAEGSSKRPYTPAITAGEQPYGVSHPLSPTSMGSPPLRHRNSNWGEEGTRLAEEEEENSRRTAPFIVSGTMLGWKLSTRGRKKSLEDSLKASDYSEHHLIPIYGFRCNDDYGGPGGTSEENRRVELRRLEARALAAERTALERRAKAEGGAGGAAFARAMSRRALARAELVQKMGDVLDVRKEKVCRGSSPEVIRAYRKHVRDRLHGERIRRRTVRGLPARRPTRITAVTSRAELAGGSDRPATDDEEGGGNKKIRAKAAALADSSSSAEEDELGGIEPYLLLVRAKHRQETARAGGKAGAGGVPFCAGCLGGCKKGSCSRP